MDRPACRVEVGWIGLIWGLGDGLGAARPRLAGRALATAIGIEIASVGAEPLVAVVLIGVGLAALPRARGLDVHARSDP
ncbi:MAG: hypothetical protein VX460_01140 [Planctomycetota bacterium]|nr:hypothetical protein [Planctomycetota bacterium]